jgi:hypothetical protein
MDIHGDDYQQNKIKTIIGINLVNPILIDASKQYLIGWVIDTPTDYFIGWIASLILILMIFNLVLFLKMSKLCEGLSVNEAYPGERRTAANGRHPTGNTRELEAVFRSRISPFLSGGFQQLPVLYGRIR